MLWKNALIVYKNFEIAKIKAKNTGDEKYIENLQTACQQACATDAIVFGDISNKTSLVSKNVKVNDDMTYFKMNLILNQEQFT